ncbi:MAG: NACHT domain-containing protein [Rhodobacteraceae bacterium]|nr:NACHT domain-containing protein [Paracoccaceae bacterium]
MGDPGAGKTTTLKRLVAEILRYKLKYLIAKRPIPIVVTLRDENFQSLHLMIADKLGILSYFSKYKGKNSDPHKMKKKEVNDTSSLADILPILLDEMNAIIFLDGLDELDHGERVSFERELQQLARKLQKARVIITCRSGSHVRDFFNFSTYEISPLDEAQVSAVAEYWLDDPDNFFKELEKLKLTEICDRPLLLIQTLVFYRKKDYLPKQPSKLYRNLTLLLLAEWDEQRAIIRKSDYANFERDDKYDFLAALAHELTYFSKKKTFREEDLIKAYKRIHRRFELPINEAKTVARELESHTGIVVDIGAGSFQLSYLSLQEYLCAEYLVRSPLSDLKQRYFTEYPAPLAIAVALAPDPNHWFSHLVLEMGQNDEAVVANIFLNRIIIEKPSFVKSEFLGYGVLALLSILDGYSHETTQKFLDQKVIFESVGLALRRFEKKEKHYRKKLGAPEFFEGTDVAIPTFAPRPSVRYGILLPSFLKEN